MAATDLEQLLSRIEGYPTLSGRPDVRPHIDSLRRIAEETLAYPDLLSSIERRAEWPQQYEIRLQILHDAKLTQDYTGKPIEFSPYSDLHNDLLSHPELSPKLQQGFTNLQPLPFGASFEAYFAALEAALTKYDAIARAKHKGLRATDGTPLHLSTTEKPLWIFDPYKTADTDGSLVYHPKAYSSDPQSHQGKTKAELLAEDPTNAAQIHLVEPLQDIPRRGHGQTIGNRPQLEAGAAAEQYLRTIGKAPYDQEQGFTPELELTRILCHLRETDGEVLDDFQSGSACFCPAGWFPSHGGVSLVVFRREFGRLCVGRIIPGNPYSDDGARASVRIRRKS